MRSSRLESRRLRMLQAAVKVFANKGFHQTVVGDIADASKIGHGTFYGYFSNKSALFKALIEHIQARIVSELAAESFDASRSLEEYRGQLLRIGDRLFALFRKEPDLAQIIFYESWAAGGEASELAREGFDAFRLFTQMYLDHGVSHGYLKANFDTGTAAQAINVMLFESIKTVLTAADANVEYKKWQATISLMIIEGLGHPGS